MRATALTLSLFLAAAPWAGARAADDIQTRPLQFDRGASSATVKGTLTGRQTIDYTVRARGGQKMSLTLESKNAGLAFNVLPPGSNDVALPEAIGQQRWSGALPADGEYKIRLYLPRSAARRGEQAAYQLTVAIDAPPAAAASGPVSRATGRIPCAQAVGQPMGQCDFAVERAGGGSATVTVTLPDGRKRVLFFEKGKATGADLSQADGNLRFSATKEADLYMIRAGNERYEIPEAVIYGG